VIPPPRHVLERARAFPTVHSLDEALKLLENLGIVVDFFDFEDIQGMFVIFSGQPRIAVNRRLREVEKVHTLLHELAHFLLHFDNQLEPLFFGHEFLWNQEEKEADCFAWLLMSEGLREDYLNPPEEGWAE
jgi:Zn-dependent peptidase ImmA (M78 family)